MPTHSGHPYLLRMSNKSHTTPMDPQQIVAMFVEINAKLDTLKTLDERLTKLESARDQTQSKNNRRNNIENTSNSDAQYLKASRSIFPTLRDVTTYNFSWIGHSN